MNGNRRLAASQFITGAYETALAPSEVLQGIKLPRLSQRGCFGYFKVCRKAGEFALAMGAVMNDPERRHFRVVIGATKGRPIVVGDASDLLRCDNTIDEARVLRVLDQHGITDPVSRRQQVAALTRAYDQAMKP